MPAAMSTRHSTMDSCMPGTAFQAPLATAVSRVEFCLAVLRASAAQRPPASSDVQQADAVQMLHACSYCGQAEQSI